MRLTILFTLLALLTIAMAAPSPPDKGWRDYDVSDIVKNGEPRFAEYDMEKCVDVFGKPKPNFKDFSPVAGKCYDIKKSTCIRSMVAEVKYILTTITKLARMCSAVGNPIM
ncbi:hypothetical protein N431DRAFT_474056 [Stipitochalara longipes BDJ]|nr:hypothetical protein N431DRAFT_474056 [Stipitochalara longipes BDJ]